VIGISTCNAPLTRYSSRAVRMPSISWPISRQISACARPCPMPRPKRRLRDWSSVQVSTKSPTPVSPAKVSARPPRATPKRVNSARPRVINAALALAPKPRPSLMPAAIAITFLIAPPSCTPTGSLLK